MSILRGRYLLVAQRRRPAFRYTADCFSRIAKVCRVGDCQRAASDVLDWHDAPHRSSTTSFSTSPYFLANQAAQAKLGDRGFVPLSITVSDLLLFRGDRSSCVSSGKLLQFAQKLSRGSYNQIANYAYLHRVAINVAIGASSPQKYFSSVACPVQWRTNSIWRITDEVVLKRENVPDCVIATLVFLKSWSAAIRRRSFLCDDFLVQRRTLMALKPIRALVLYTLRVGTGSLP